jgi:Protein of unknown function (DUF1488)
MDIEFSTPYWSFDRNSVVVRVLADGQPIGCILSLEYLGVLSAESLDEDRALAAFESHRSQIESDLRDRIKAGDFSSPGEVTLRD